MDKNLLNQFQAALLSGDTQVKQAIQGPNPAWIATRLRVYQDAYRIRLQEALSADYPRLKTWLGDNKFKCLANDYIDAYPSHYPSMRYFPQDLPQFLQTHHAKHPEYADIAALEWALHDCLNTADSVCLSLSDLQSIDPEQWAELRVSPHPSWRLVTVHSNALDILTALSENQKAPALVYNAGHAIVISVWRKGVNSHFRHETAASAWTLQALAAGQCFGEICEGLVAYYPEPEVPGAAVAQLIDFCNAAILGTVFQEG